MNFEKSTPAGNGIEPSLCGRKYIDEPRAVAYSALIIFIINPLISLTLLYFYILLRAHQHLVESRLLLRIYYLLFSIFLGLLNSTKTPENDLVWYYEGYLDAGHQSFLYYITNFGINAKGYEIGLPILNYFIYYLIGKNTSLYIIIFTVFYYTTISLSVHRLGERYSISPAKIATAIFIIFIAPNIFSLSAVILRQNLAAAIIAYLFIEKIVFNKNRFGLMAFCVLTHTSSLFFIALLFLPGIRQPLSLKNLPIFAALGLLILNYQQLAALLLALTPGDNALTYVLARASSGTTYELPPLQAKHLAFNSLIICILLLSIYFLKRSLRREPGLTGFSNYIVLAWLFIISNIHYVELSVRFNFYLMTFIPHISLIILATLKEPPLRPVLALIHIPLYIIFFLLLYESQWTYSVKIESLYLPIPYYFLNNFNSHDYLF